MKTLDNTCYNCTEKGKHNYISWELIFFVFLNYISLLLKGNTLTDVSYLTVELKENTVKLGVQVFFYQEKLPV